MTSVHLDISLEDAQLLADLLGNQLDHKYATLWHYVTLCKEQAIRRSSEQVESYRRTAYGL